MFSYHYQDCTNTYTYIIYEFAHTERVEKMYKVEQFLLRPSCYIGISVGFFFEYFKFNDSQNYFTYYVFLSIRKPVTMSRNI